VSIQNVKRPGESGSPFQVVTTVPFTMPYPLPTSAKSHDSRGSNIVSLDRGTESSLAAILAQLDCGDPARFFAGREGADYSALAAAVNEVVPIARGEDGGLYAYLNGYYTPIGEDAVKTVATRLLGRHFRKNHINEVVEWFKAQPWEIPSQPDPKILNVANGLLDWRTGQLSPHSPDHYSIIRIPVRWDPAATCPRISAFLAEVLARDAIDLVLELAGYALYPGNPFRKAVLFLGPTGTGKTVLLAVISALLGAQNVSNVPLHTLQNHRYAPAELYGKLANICGDLEARQIEGSSVFKQITGGDAVLGERKYGQPFSFTPFALPLFSANEAPASSDLTDAWFERWLVVEMINQFVGPNAAKSADPDLRAKLTTPEELSGLLNLAVTGLQRLMARDEFALPASVTRAMTVYRRGVDTLERFVDERCILDAEAATRRSAVFEAYCRWCGEEGLRPEPRSEFYHRLETGWRNLIKRGRNNKIGFVLKGVRLIED
jgi:putative DNA primase/helicase